MPITLSFETQLTASPDAAWRWITSVDGISREMAPFLRMSVPQGVTDLSSVSFQSGVPMFTSWITLFGLLPVDCSKLTLMSLSPGTGFVEQSPMGSMKLWRHERQITPLPTGCRITDTLTFEPRFAKELTTRIIQAFFSHRHRMQRRHLG